MFTAQNLQIWIDGVQTVFLGLVAWALIYVMLLLRNEMRAAAGALNRVLTGQAEIEKRVEALENQRRPGL